MNMDVFLENLTLTGYRVYIYQFQELMSEHGFNHVFKVGHKDLAHIDKAVGVLNAKVAIRAT